MRWLMKRKAKRNFCLPALVNLTLCAAVLIRNIVGVDVCLHMKMMEAACVGS